MARNKHNKKPYYPFESKSALRMNGRGEEKHIFTENGKDHIETTTLICWSMLTSGAFCDLTPRQRMLYICAKSLFYGSRSSPKREYPDITEFQRYKKADYYFYLNHNLVTSVFKLYPKSNHRDLYKDIRALVGHGFIEYFNEPKAVNSSNHMRTIYCFSDGWKQWKPGHEYIKEGNTWKWVQI